MTPKSGYIFLFVFLSQVRHSTARIEWCKTMKHFDSFERVFFFISPFQTAGGANRAGKYAIIHVCARVCLYTQV